MVRSLTDHLAALRDVSHIDPALRAMTVGQYLEGCAMLLGAPYPLWLLEKFHGRYFSDQNAHISRLPLRCLLDRNAEESRAYWEPIYQLLPEMFHLIYLKYEADKEKEGMLYDEP